MVSGYPVGADISLARIALRSLGRRAAEAPQVLPCVHLDSAPRLVEACLAQETEFLVLQLGHQETLPSLRHARSHRDRSCPSPGGAAQIPFVPEPNKLYQPTLHDHVRKLRQFAVAQAQAVLGHKKRACDLAAAAAALDSLLSCLAPLPLRAVLLLSPFSCPDLATRAHRRNLLPVFAAAAAKHKCHYVDVFAMLEDCRHHESYLANFADQFHLSRQGHLRVGMLIGQTLRRAVRETNPGYLPSRSAWPPIPSLHMPVSTGAITL